MERKKIINETSLRSFLTYKKLKSKNIKEKYKAYKKYIYGTNFCSKIIYKTL